MSALLRIMQRMFRIRYYDRPITNDLMHTDEGKLQKVLRPWWKIG